MSRMGGAVTARLRVALTVVVGGVVALLMPWLSAPADAASLVVVTALAVAALGGGSDRRAATRPTAVPAPRRPPAEPAGAVLLPGRVTDTPHHPVLPRAPGSV